MLYVNLFFSLILLASTNLANLKKGLLVPTAVVVGLLVSIGPVVFPGIALFVTWELGALLIILAAVAVQQDRKRSFYLSWSVALTFALFAINCAYAWIPTSAKIERLRAKYPYESLEGRLPERPATDAELSEHSAQRLTRLESELSGYGVTYFGQYPKSSNFSGSYGASRMLYELHEDTIDEFINRPNFGYARLIGQFSESVLAANRRNGQSVMQPGRRSASTGLWDNVGKEIRPYEDLDRLHDTGVWDFLNPRLHWYFKDRQHVAGFQSHQFSEVPDAGKKWKLQALDLMGLVVHEKPVVYLSESLPRMDELRKAPMRELNAFESAGLKALRNGDDIFVREMPDHSLRMLGSLRAMKQCIDCHGGARGDLLGAFSYELRKE